MMLPNCSQSCPPHLLPLLPAVPSAAAQPRPSHPLPLLLVVPSTTAQLLPIAPSSPSSLASNRALYYYPATPNRAHLTLFPRFHPHPRPLPNHSYPCHPLPQPLAIATHHCPPHLLTIATQPRRCPLPQLLSSPAAALAAATRCCPSISSLLPRNRVIVPYRCRCIICFPSILLFFLQLFNPICRLLLPTMPPSTTGVPSLDLLPPLLPALAAHPHTTTDRRPLAAAPTPPSPPQPAPLLLYSHSRDVSFAVLLLPFAATAVALNFSLSPLPPLPLLLFPISPCSPCNHRRSCYCLLLHLH
ncbi:hypothetical protein BHM03_00040384 [Ensete ventricosum]|nr:hypothetical protein BHM03_00040384 [Ensete ventricosum]